MIDVIKKLADAARWELEIFSGALKIQGRILSPVEAQAAGIASRSLMGKMLEIIKGQEEESQEQQDEQEALLSKIASLTPEDVLNFGNMQDRVLCQVVDKASQDGENWEKLTLVHHEKQQNPARNALWVGMIPQEDKNKIFERAMQGLKGGEIALNSFPK
tara:strand:- start:124 stop:603 length:480 start_codon:yes stop_codon:yes gene_type:complete